ncbi:DNA replication protein, partial [Acinetobacter baumannii]
PVQNPLFPSPFPFSLPPSSSFFLLRPPLDLLKNQLDDAKNRESFYQNQIETMQRLLEAPKTNTTQSDDPGPTQAESTVEEK